MIERTYRISDVVKEDFLRFPLSLLANPKYREISLEAKFIYTLLLNRLTLSQKNGWINEDNEVYLIYTREEASNILSISYRKAIAAFKELIAVGLLFEQRQGRGYPNLLYVLKAELENEDASDFSENFNKPPEEQNFESEESAEDSQICKNCSSRHAENAHQDMQDLQVKICKNGTSRDAENAGQDITKLQSKKNNNIKNKNNQLENSQSVSQEQGLKDGQTESDDETLEKIFRQCEMHLFQPNIAVMLKNAIERMYYSDTLKVGNARLPQSKVREYLQLLNSEILTSVLEKMKENGDRITNPTAYLMSLIFNAICEVDSNFILDLPPDYLSFEDLYVPHEY